MLSAANTIHKFQLNSSADNSAGRTVLKQELFQYKKCHPLYSYGLFFSPGKILYLALKNDIWIMKIKDNFIQKKKPTKACLSSGTWIFSSFKCKIPTIQDDNLRILWWKIGRIEMEDVECTQE